MRRKKIIRWKNMTDFNPAEDLLLEDDDDDDDEDSDAFSDGDSE